MITSTYYSNLKTFAVEHFIEALNNENSADYDAVLYLTFGKTDAWANDSNPPVANASVSSVYEIWDNMIGAKRLFSGDLACVIPRYNWTPNTSYHSYDNLHHDIDDANVQFYIVNSQYGVYKCLANANNSVSTVEPTAVSPTTVTNTADGYIWKYMYTLSDSDKLRFMTDSYIPVRTLKQNNGSLQWQVQQSAKNGSIEVVLLQNGGSAYTNTSNLIVTISGDGTDATATANVNNVTNSINNIVVTNSGQNYTYATVTISGGGGSGASARAIISPPGGHGSNPMYELFGSNVMLNAQIKYSENNVLPTTNDYRQISLLKDPILAATSNVATNLAVLQATTITTAGSGDYQEDEIVYQGTNLATSVYSGTVVSWDSTTGNIKLINTKGTPTASRSLIGSSSYTSRVVTSVATGGFSKHSGQIIYSDNITPVTRSNDQIEDYKIVVKF